MKAEYGGTLFAVFCAAQSGSVEGLEYVLGVTGVSPESRNPQGMTLLHQAAASNSAGAGDVVRFLLAKGVKPNQPNHAGQTALHMAV